MDFNGHMDHNLSEHDHYISEHKKLTRQTVMTAWHFGLCCIKRTVE
jgi:hypothetical protein